MEKKTGREEVRTRARRRKKRKMKRKKEKGKEEIEEVWGREKRMVRNTWHTIAGMSW